MPNDVAFCGLFNSTPSQVFLTTTEEHGFGKKYLVIDGKVSAHG